jgi:hypothetical protein
MTTARDIASHIEAHRRKSRHARKAKSRIVAASRLKQGDLIAVPREYSNLHERVRILAKTRTRRYFSRGTAFDLTIVNESGTVRKILTLGEDSFERFSE